MYRTTKVLNPEPSKAVVELVHDPVNVEADGVAVNVRPDDDMRTVLRPPEPLLPRPQHPRTDLQSSWLPLCCEVHLHHARIGVKTKKNFNYWTP